MTESDCDQNIDEKVAIIVENNNSPAEEDLLDDGEQRYETDGDESPQETLTDRLMALPIGARTPRVE